MTTRANLRTWRRCGRAICFRLGQTDDYWATVNEFKARVPAAARSYDEAAHEWRVERTYEDDLRVLFSNYAEMASPNPLTRWQAQRRARYYAPPDEAPASRRWTAGWLLGPAATLLIVVLLWQLVADSPLLEAVTGARATPAPQVVTASLPPADLARLVQAEVVSVVDGDTIEVAIDGEQYRLRYIGMDTPERGQPFYRESAARNRELVGGARVYLEQDVSETDRFGRLLRYVYRADGRMVNEMLVAEGFAATATFPPDVKYVARLQAAERAAQQAKLGLWRE